MVISPEGDPFVVNIVLEMLSLVVEVRTLERESALLGTFPFLAHMPSWRQLAKAYQ